MALTVRPNVTMESALSVQGNTGQPKGVSPHLPGVQPLHPQQNYPGTEQGDFQPDTTVDVFRISMIASLNKRQCWSKEAVLLLGHYS